jgi:hypothetical protein
VKNLREALEATDIRNVLAAPQTLEASAAEFNAMHQRWCSSICSNLKQHAVANVTYGRAAKLVAVYLKAIVIMSDACNSSLGHNLHPPIDRILLHGLASSKRLTSPHQASWRSINWTQLDVSAYERLVDQLRDVIPDGTPFWTIEEYWEPSDTEDDPGVSATPQ